MKNSFDLPSNLAHTCLEESRESLGFNQRKRDSDDLAIQARLNAVDRSSVDLLLVKNATGVGRRSRRDAPRPAPRSKGKGEAKTAAECSE